MPYRPARCKPSRLDRRTASRVHGGMPTQARPIIHCDLRHAESILAIFNDAILNSTALYDYKPRTRAMMDTWFDAKTKGRYPVLGIEDADGTLMGFASYGAFRAWPAYKYSVEHSVYVDSRFRGQGIGRQLLAAIVEAAKAQDFHTVIGGIDAENAASIALHRSFGFEKCASIKHAGFKFGRWLDLEFYQLLLPTPANPHDD
jgi:L-amino acid N-acyltransferase